MKMTQTVTLNSGQQAELHLFVRETKERFKYFPYQLSGPDATRPTIPEDYMKFDDSREFVIEISHSYGKKRKRIGARVTRGLTNIP